MGKRTTKAVVKFEQEEEEEGQEEEAKGKTKKEDLEEGESQEVVKGRVMTGRKHLFTTTHIISNRKLSCTTKYNICHILEKNIYIFM